MERASKRRKFFDFLEPVLKEICYQEDYQYAPLEEGRIRVLVLEPGNEHDNLVGSLEVAHLDDAIYSAISYAWGQRTSSHTIKLGEKNLTIHESAYNALKRFRKPTDCRHLWIDAVCINQNDVGERNAQVARMGEVYRNADVVLVWLGASTASDTMAFWACHRLAAAWDEWKATERSSSFQQWSGASKAGFARRSLIMSGDGGQCPCCGQLCAWKPARRGSDTKAYVSSYNVAQNSVRELFSKPCFRRLWPVQEIYSAQQCTFIAGNHSLPLKDIYHALEMLSVLQSQLKQTAELFRLLVAVEMENGGLRLRTPLLDLLAITRHLDTDIAHDRIYALRAVTEVSTAENLMPDYSMPLAKLCIEVSARILNNSQSQPAALQTSSRGFAHPSAILAQSGYQRAGHIRVGLPSWVLDLGDIASNHWMKYQHYQSWGQKFCAGGKGKFEAKWICGLRDQLGLQATQLCTISAIFGKSEIEGGGDLYLLYCFATRGGRFDGLHKSKSTADRQAAADELAVLFVHGHEDLSEDGLSSCLNELDIFTEKCRVGSMPGNERRSDQRDSRVLKPIESTQQKTFSNDDRQIARMIFGRTFPMLYVNGKGKELDRTRLMAAFSDGRIGWVPQGSESGDAVFVLKGAPCPFVFRAWKDGTFENVGDAYVHGVMYGEAWNDGTAIETITLR